jgi:arylsulfatase A-like enzyme
MLGVDDSIGRITETLRELGQLNETMIIYYSDNGYLLGEHGLIDKRVMYEESIRVPCFVHCPALMREPKMDSSFILNIDLAPTILDIARIPKPESMHGESFYPILKSEPTQWRTDFIYEYFFDLNAPQTPFIFGLRNEKYSYMTYYGVWDINELYDLETDPDQKYNLLGDIQWGNTYGTFNRHVRQQNPELYTLVEKLDIRLTELLEMTNGKRQPTWHD